MNFWKQYGKWVAFFVLVVGFSWLFELLGLRGLFAQWFQNILRPWLENHPILAPFVFIFIYVLTTILMIPASIMTVAGGAVFGPLWGTVYVSLAAVVGAGIAFLIARYLLAEWIEENIGSKLRALKSGIERDGVEFVAITRLVPIFPFNVLNYAFGLTKINFWTYFWVTGVAMLPGSFAYVYAGYVGRELFAGKLGLIEMIIISSSAIGIFITLGLIPRWMKRFGNEI